MVDQRAKFSPRGLTVEFVGEALGDRDAVRWVIGGKVQLMHTCQPSRVSLDYPGIWGLIQGSRDSYNNPGILSRARLSIANSSSG